MSSNQDEALDVAIVAPSPVPFTIGGAERAVAGLAYAINHTTPHRAEVFKLPVDERTLPGIISAYQRFSHLDLKHFDRVISVKYPAWMVEHPAHTVFMFHPLRGLYDTYPAHELPLEVPDPAGPTEDLLRLLTPSAGRETLPEVFGWFGLMVDKLGEDHPDLAFPGPLARRLVRWLDRVALATDEMADHVALSQTVADRSGYFPPGVTPRVVHLPGPLDPGPEPGPRTHLFTASRLDGPKRVDLIIAAMAHVATDIELVIAGGGPDEDRLRALAAGNDRIRFIGFVTDDELRRHYATAVAVPFVPLDEDLGLITLEAMERGTPIITTTDAGGPTEFVTDGVTGLVTEPDPAQLGAAINALVSDPRRAEALGRAALDRAAEVTWSGAIDALVGAGSRAGRRRRADRALPGRPAPERGSSGRPRIVIPATFPIDRPVGGGQLRARHLYAGLTTQYDVELVALVDWDTPPSRRELAPGLVQTLVPRTATHRDACLSASLEVGVPVADIVSGHEPGLTPGYLTTLAEAAEGATAVVLAEPYLVRAVEQAGIVLPTVYDAYNVEADLKAEALPDTPLGQRLLAQAVALERQAVLGSTAIVTCSDTDAAAMVSRYGCDPGIVTSIANGAEIPPDPAGASERAHRSHRWLQRYHRTGPLGRHHQHLAVFFGSWHPPNVDAVWLLTQIADSLPEVLIVGAGSHGDAFYDRVVPANLVFTGVVAEATRKLLLRSADVALNPMRIGSGTNLKLIEYLAHQIPTVSTPFGARGVGLVDGEHARLAEPDRFAEAVAEMLDDPESSAAMAAAGRDLVADRFGWPSLGARLLTVVDAAARR